MTIAYTKLEIGEGGVIPYMFPLGAMWQSLKLFSVLPILYIVCILYDRLGSILGFIDE